MPGHGLGHSCLVVCSRLALSRLNIDINIFVSVLVLIEM